MQDQFLPIGTWISEPESFLHCFQRFKNKCEDRVKIIRGEKEEVDYFTITKTYRKLIDLIQDPKDLVCKILEYELLEVFSSFDSVIKLLIEILRYNGIGAISYWIVPKPYCNSKSILNTQKWDDKCFSLWWILALLHNLDKNRERASYYDKHFTEPNIGDIQFLKEIKNIPKFEQSNNLNKVFLN